MTDLQVVRTNSTTGAKKVDQLWFDDADVVFQAGNKLFRVHRSILSARSTIFRDMFAIPQKEKENSVTADDEVTVIHLPDEGVDVHYFFLAIFDASFYNPPPSKYPLLVTVSILRLAHKYDIPFLKRRAIAHLDSFFPLDRAKLDAIAEDKKEFTVAKLRLYLHAIPLAVISDAQWILPSLLYLLVSQWSTTEIINQSSFRELSPGLQAITMEFREQYALELHNQNGWIGVLPSRLCSDEETCGLLSRMVQNLHHQCSPAQYLRKMDVGESFTNNGKKLCKQCQVAGRKYQKYLVDLYWNKYPAVCGFSGWEDLKKMRHVAITA